MCEYCDNVFHPKQIIHVTNFGGQNRLSILYEARREVIHIENLIHYCPMCGRKLTEHSNEKKEAK